MSSPPTHLLLRELGVVEPRHAVQQRRAVCRHQAHQHAGGRVGEGGAAAHGGGEAQGVHRVCQLYCLALLRRLWEEKDMRAKGGRGRERSREGEKACTPLFAWPPTRCYSYFPITAATMTILTCVAGPLLSRRLGTENCLGAPPLPLLPPGRSCRRAAATTDRTLPALGGAVRAVGIRTVRMASAGRSEEATGEEGEVGSSPHLRLFDSCLIGLKTVCCVDRRSRPPRFGAPNKLRALSWRHCPCMQGRLICIACAAPHALQAYPQSPW